MRIFSLSGFLGVVLFFCGIPVLRSQSILTVEDACSKAVANYPATQQKSVFDVQTTLALEQLNKNYFPQVSFLGQASYQSEVTKIQIPLPNFSVTPLDKDQYKLVADVNQLLYDGGLLSSQKKLQQLQFVTEKQKLEVELYRLKDRVRQLYFGVLLMDAQLRMLDLMEKDLKESMDKTSAQVLQGIATPTAFNVLKAEWMKVAQRRIENEAGRKGLVDALNVWVGPDQTVSWTFVWPKIEASTLLDTIVRPELELFQMQQHLLKEQDKINHLKNYPKAGAFVQGGYGRPGLNFLKNDFSPFYIAGIKLNWSLGGLYTKRQEERQILQQSKQISLQEQSFLMGTRAQLKQVASELLKYKELIAMDHSIIELKEQVLLAIKVQLEQGLITTHDFLRELNALDQARQQLITHQIQQLQANQNYETLRGE